ncbi:TIGR03960 family B12-binding radical SAM protein [Geomonas sp. Red69]|uniref:TIGR03960 family B12-binding radical SAM protein n=1 Tax=Geomonas diazotrophica TaxID=2843197 RepID=A0ABX8JIF8_9BACT|nr:MULTISPECIES: TIGR03960 family B12-binding radical SAM protein [Geomonas]MBU5635418.1 TIGR03960 family B12-binding radical SAM protein [Geomonas diazotrophica]QWV97528.1 TIGR03960 family B12-binding radical SAM protein [Geomonas nitrogeniifigens]QXE86668.1 TIGR03960 family B12-binding radical SAM protein [Geomonas nitrogeniifigens]
MSNNILLSVEKPARYMGGEMGTVADREGALRFVLAFPDVYEIGMSHLGLQVLYGVLKEVPWVMPERAYAPWPDLEESLRAEAKPLVTLEAGTPLADADILGFTLQYELSYTNILNMLDLSGIPLLACDRPEGYPLVIAGGPCAYNPEPLADFFDAFLIGDGEEAVIELADCVRTAKEQGVAKAELLERLARIEGVYVPSLFEVSYHDDGRVAAITPVKEWCQGVRRRFVADLETAYYPTSPIVPFLKTVHDRVSVEISRGCTRGCRFCQAGYIYRPVRERSPERIFEIMEEALHNTGYDEISLLSLSTGDYGCLTPLLKGLMDRYSAQKKAVSLPSMRVGSLSDEMAEEIRRVRKTGFTLAPEAGSERLRSVINKGITEEALLENARSVYGNGWRLIKLYFMIGLPTETMEDVDGIVELSREVKRQGKFAGNGGDVNVSVSSFVPKPHTPFQWEPQISEAEIVEKQRYLRDALKKKKLIMKWQDASLSGMEGVFARGDRRLSKLLIEAHRLGCRFDGWWEHFDRLKWVQAFENSGIDASFYLRRRELDEVLPWDHIDCGVTKPFLLKEREASLVGAPTPDCRFDRCTGCGVCDFKEIKLRLNEPVPFGTYASQAAVPETTEEAQRIRIRFEKVGRMRFLSHLEMLTLFTRAVGRSGIPIRFSQGFHPHPKFSFATALSVGIESYAEYMDFEVDAGYTAAQLQEALNATLPGGVRVLEAQEIALRAPALSVIMDKVRYRVTLPEELACDLEAKAAAFLALESSPVKREKKGKSTEFDLRHELAELKVEGRTLEMVAGRGKLLEFASAILGVPADALKEVRLEKLEVLFKE